MAPVPGEAPFELTASRSLALIRRLAMLSAGLFALPMLWQPAPLYALPALGLVLLSLAMRALDPRAYCLQAEPGGLWRLWRGSAGGSSGGTLCAISNRSRLRWILWLECRSAAGDRAPPCAAGIPAVILLPQDSLAPARWRALRRLLRLQSQSAGGGEPSVTGPQ